MTALKILLIVLGFFVVDSILKLFFDFGLIDGDLFTINIEFITRLKK